MSGFTQQAFEKKLSDLNPSQQSIQTLSLWLIHHRKHYKTIVQIWFKELKRVKSSRKLTFMYLANDVIQNSRKKGPEYAKEFLNYLAKSFENISKEIDSSTLASLDRLLKIWEERNIYDKNDITSFKQALHNNVKLKINSNSSSNHLNVNSKKKERDPRDNGHIDKKFSSLDSNALNIMMSKIGTLITNFPVDMNKYEYVEPENFIQTLKELENCASADEVTRQNISNLPKELFDLKLFENIINNESLDNWAKVSIEAREMLNAYNVRLAQELQRRTQLATQLAFFMEGERRELTKAEHNLNDLKDKLKKVISAREELISHLDNLPDLSQLPSVTPLPSAVDLFKKETR